MEKRGESRSLAVAWMTLLAFALLCLTACSTGTDNPTPASNTSDAQPPRGERTSEKTEEARSTDSESKEQAVDFPTKPIRLVVTHPVGSTTEAAVRFLEPSLREVLGQPIIIDNMDGAGGNLARSYVWKQPPDGYTLLVTYVPSIDIGPIVSPDVDFVPLEFTPVANLVGGKGFSPVIYVNKDSPFQTLEEFAEAGRAKPDTILVGHSGFSTAAAASLRLFEKASGAKYRDVPYGQVSDAMAAAAGGQIDAIVHGSPPAVISLVEQGEGRVLGVFGPERDPAFPDAPTAGEMGYANVNMNQKISLFAPPNTPRPVVDILAQAIAKAAEDAGFQKRLKEYGQPLEVLDPDELHEQHRELAAAIESVRDMLIPEPR